MNILKAKAMLWKLYLLGFILFIFGIFHHLDIYNILVSGAIYSDNGDGFFNLWLLEKGRQKLILGEIANFLDGGIYWPKGENSYFWSDNLIIYTPIYSLLKWLFSNPYVAYSSLSLILTLAAFLANVLFFYNILLIWKQNKPDVNVVFPLFLVPILSYLNTFSEIKIRYYLHWQNLSYFWFFTLLTGMLVVSARKCDLGTKSRYFALMIISELALLYSSLYFAVAGCILILAWLVVQARLDFSLILDLVKKRFGILGVSLGLVGVLGWIYSHTRPMKYSEWYINGNSVKFWHLITPKEGWIKSVLENFNVMVPEVNSEVCAYLGIGVIAAVIILTFHGLLNIKNIIKSMNLKLLITLFSIFAICRISLEFNKDFASNIGFLAIGSLILFALVKAGSFKNSKAEVKAAIVLSLGLFVSYGIAFGPIAKFIPADFNSSIWGVLKTIFPPVDSMRALGRLGSMGQAIICGLLYILYLNRQSSSKSKLPHLLAISLCILQFMDPIGTKAVNNHYPVSQIIPNNEEKVWWNKNPGEVVVFPSKPYHENSEIMLYFSQFQDIKLLNGYSSRSTPLWDKMMSLEGDLEPNKQQILLAKNTGAKFLVVLKWRRSNDKLSNITELNNEIVFENDRIQVWSL